MTAYVGKRLLLLIPTLLGVSVLTFLLIHLIPGDLVTILLGITASQNEQTRQALIHALHLDRPLAVQYLLWLGEVLRGDLGHSLVTGFSVRDELVRSYPVTLQLALMAMSIALAVGIPMGALAATRAGRALDASTRVFSLLFISAPAFFIGTVVIIAGARYAPWLPTLGHVPFTESPARSLLTMLPAAASLGLAISAIIARFTRASMLEVIHQRLPQKQAAFGSLGVDEPAADEGPVSAPVTPAPTLPPGSARYLGNSHTRELHDLLNQRPQCQLDEIPIDRKYPVQRIEEALALGYDFCAYCFGPGWSTR